MLRQMEPPFTVALLFYNDLQVGALQYKALGTYASADEANARVQKELAKWREEDARPACEDRVRHLEGQERAAEMRRLVQTSVSVTARRDSGLLTITTSLKGLDVMGTSNHWQWRPLPAWVDLADAARDFYRELRGVSGQAADIGCIPEPHPYL